MFNSNQILMIDLNTNPNVNEDRKQIKNKMMDMFIFSNNEHNNIFLCRFDMEISDQDKNLLDYFLNNQGVRGVLNKKIYIVKVNYGI